MKQLITVLATFAFLTLGAPAWAQGRGPAPHSNPYEQLLPADFIVRPAPAVDRAERSNSVVAIIPSANFNAYTEAQLRRQGERGNLVTAVMGIRPEQTAGILANGDPRNLSDRIVETLRPHFSNIVIASDLPSARDSGAAYFVIVDYWGSYRSMNSRFASQAGVYILNSQLELSFASSRDAVVPRISPPGFMPSIQAEYDAQAQTLANGLNAVAEPVLAELEQHLSASN